LDEVNNASYILALKTLVDCLTSFERILRTPIPLAYSVHLHHAVWIYLLALPFQLVNQLNWFAIPAVTLASFALLGILGIGWEIENPFGHDDNDLVNKKFSNCLIFVKNFSKRCFLFVSAFR
jgi:predicted membrane chloride channel (bestrophin family)